MTQQAKQLAELLKKKRMQAGHSQRDVADKLGYSTPQFISNWERGVSIPPLSSVPKLADLYHMSIDDLGGAIITLSVGDYRATLVRKLASLKGPSKLKVA